MRGLELEDLQGKRRKGMRTYVAAGLFGAIIMVFVFWGMNPRSAGGVLAAGGGAAIVNSSLISVKDVAEALENMRQYQGSQPGDSEMQRMQAIDQLVKQEVAFQSCTREGFLASDAAIAEVIRTAPIFVEDGKFRRERYMAFLQNRGYGAGEFEEKLRKGEVLRDAQKVFSEALRPLDIEIKRQADVKNIKANLEYFAMPADNLVQAASVTAEQVKEFSAGKDAEKKISDYYNANMPEFTVREGVHARHILVKAEGQNTDAALKKAKELIARIKKGEDFAKLAKENSDDPGSKNNGGDLGFFERGAMVQEFGDAAFKQKDSEISEPVKTMFGYHIIQTLEHRAAKTTPLAEAKDRIVRTLIAKEGSAKAMDELNALLAKKDAAGVSSFASRHQLKWDSTGNFNLEAQAIPKIGSSDEIGRIAFALTAAKPMAEHAVRVGASAYVLKYKALEPEKKDAKTPQQAMSFMDKPEFMVDSMAYQRGMAVFSNWVTAQEKVSHIEKNYSASARGGEPAPEF